MSDLCPHCEGEMDALGGVHLKDCPDAQSVGSPTPEEKVDHAEEARGVLRWTVGDQGPQALSEGDPRVHPALQLAQVHALLAIAEEVRGIREALNGINKRVDAVTDYDGRESGFRGKKKLRVTRG